MREYAISYRRERGIVSIGDELLVVLMSVPKYEMEGTVNKLSE